MSASEHRIRTAVSEQAAAWFIANREPDPGDGGDEEFAVWLRSSARHVEEYLQIAAIARSLPRAVSLPQPELERLVAQARAAIALPDGHRRGPPGPARRLRRSLVAAAAAALAAVAISLLWPRGEPVAVERFATRHGEQATRRLADGTSLQLDTDSAVSVRFSAHERRVELERGQARFEVAHDPRRPLTVVAGAVSIVDLGTVFDVYRRDTETLVTVIEGNVCVALTQSAARSVRVAAGERLVIAADVLPEQAEPIDADRASGWLRREIAFEHTPLEVVAGEFNRYGAVPIVIETPALRSLAISGVFVADDAETFVAFLRSLNGVRVEISHGAIRVTQI